MAEDDEYYGSQKARDAYIALQEAYRACGWTDVQMDVVLQLEIPPDAYFNALGIYNYHGDVNVMYEDEAIIQWMLHKQKSN